MKTSLAFLSTLILTSLLSMASATTGSSKWSISGRDLPAPAAASHALKESIAAASAPDVSASIQNAPRTLNDWHTFTHKMNQYGETKVNTLIKQYGTRVKLETIAGVTVRQVMPRKVAPEHKNHLFIDLHSGGFVVFAGDSSIMESVLIAERLGIPVLAIDYPVLPEHPFPVALDDVVKVYKHLLTTRPAHSMAIGGTSAGGNLAMAAIQKFNQLGLETPAVLYGGTPWADLSKTGDTLFTNEGIDRLLVTYDGWLKGAALKYAAGRDLKHPLISPVYGDLHGFPPTYLVTGTRDMLLSDTIRTHRKLKAAGVTADLNVYEGLSHAGYLLVSNSPESLEIYKELNQFLLKHMKVEKKPTNPKNE